MNWKEENRDPLFMDSITRYSDILLAIGVMVILGIIVVPLPSAMLDVLLALNITMALIILMVAMYILEPLQFSVFPGLLLLVTLFRLALNVASTRLILGDGYAGTVIQAFGTFVVKGNYVVGFIMFLILVVIQFVVITKGAGRIAEVAARFTLDAMPGKQMSIDADLSAGLIDDRTARQRRETISREADFYGAMDGASKFVRGDAIAGLIITIINILGGLIIGVVQLGMPFDQALQTYTVLTVGDGLVTQIPALVVSTSAGLIVTRAASESNLGHDLIQQVLVHPRAIAIVAVVLLLFSIAPGMPTIPFLLLSVIVGGIAYKTNQAKRYEVPAEEEEAIEPAPEERIEGYLRVDPLEIEIGRGLISIVDASQGGDLLDRITIIRQQCAVELGIVVPPIRIRDNAQLRSNEYVIKLKGVDVAKGELMRDRYMAISTGDVEEEIEGISTVEPAFGMPALWIVKSQRERAELAGYTVVESRAVLAAHLMEVIRSHAYELLGREEVQRLIDYVKEDNPTVVNELIPNVMTIGGVQKVLQALLKENVPIKDIVTILETLADYAVSTQDPFQLTEYVRSTLSHTITIQYAGEDNTIWAATLSPELERRLSGIFQNAADGAGLSLPPNLIRDLCTDLATKADVMVRKGRQPVLVCSPDVRRYIKRLVEPSLPNMAVLSYTEIPQNISLHAIGAVTLPNEN